MSRGKTVIRKEVRFIEEVRMSWQEMIGQFKEIVEMFKAIENRVLAEGRLDSRVFDALMEHERVSLSPTGAEFLRSLVKQSEKLLVEEDDDAVWLIPNPDYEPTEVRPVEVWEEKTNPEITGVNDIPVRVDGHWVKKVHATKPILDVKGKEKAS